MDKYNTLTQEIIDEIKAVSNHVFLGDAISPDYERDEMPIYGTHKPDLVVQARSTKEVSDVMKICYEHTIPVTARGAGTGLAGGCVPMLGGVVMDISQMNHILNYDLENFVVNVEAGVLLKELQEDCITKGLMYPPDPGEKYACLGGNVATNAGGMRAVKYGTTRDYVRAMTVVLANGEITHFGATVSKTSSGYSLLNLMIGSEGTLGIITELTLKIIPAPKATASLIVPFTDLQTALSAVPKFKMAHMDPQAIEFMESDIVKMTENFINKTVFPKEYRGQDIRSYLLITLDGGSQEDLDQQIDQAAKLCFENHAMEVFIAETPTQISNAWAARSAFYEAITDEIKLLDECDVVIPINHIVDFLTFVNKIGKDLGLDITCYGHAGDGNIHIYQCSNEMNEEEFMAKNEQFFDVIYAKAVEFGGEVSGEHGIGSSKMKYLENSIGKTNIDLMEGIKRVFDPKMILNPGKVCHRL